MGDFATTLLSQYGLAGQAFFKERGAYILGAQKLHKTSDNHDALYARHDLLAQIDLNGFTHTDKIKSTLRDMPFVEMGRDTYVLTRHVRGREVDLESPADMTLAVQAIARMHSAARGIKHQVQAQPLHVLFAKDTAFLAKVQRQIGNASRLQDFDVLVLKNIGAYIARADAAAQLLAQTNYNSLHLHALSHGHVCHNNIKEDMLILHEGTCHIGSFGQATLGVQLCDLANFILRYATKGTRKMPYQPWLSAYNEILPLSPCAQDITRAVLMYPWQFIKLARNYYSKKRGWVPGAIASKMEELLQVQPEIDEYCGYN